MTAKTDAERRAGKKKVQEHNRDWTLRRANGSLAHTKRVKTEALAQHHYVSPDAGIIMLVWGTCPLNFLTAGELWA